MIARILYYFSFVAIAATVSIVGVRMWHDAHLRRPGVAVAVAITPDGWLELADDRRTITSLASPGTSTPRWTVAAPGSIDMLAIAGPLVLALSPTGVTAFELASGGGRFAWDLPAGETWAPPRPLLLGACLVTITRRAGDAEVRCLDPVTGRARWVTQIAGGGPGCVQPPLALRGAYIVQCAGWTSIIDDATGAATVDPGGRGIVQLDPPYLLRASPYLVTAPWFEAERRFAKTGEPVRGTTDFIGPSAVRRWDRLVVRASSASDKLAVVSPQFGNATVIASPTLHLADDTPLVLACGGKAPPRFQLVDLAPLLTAKFDPELAQQRAYGLLDVVQTSLAWDSKPFVPVHARVTETSPLCLEGHYFVPLAIRTASGEIESALWIVDAEAGTTTAVVAFDPESGHGFDQLSADQIAGHRLVGIGATGVYELDWSAALTSAGLHDARADVERQLGPLP